MLLSPCGEQKRRIIKDTGTTPGPRDPLSLLCGTVLRMWGAPFLTRQHDLYVKSGLGSPAVDPPPWREKERIKPIHKQPQPTGRLYVAVKHNGHAKNMRCTGMSAVQSGHGWGCAEDACSPMVPCMWGNNAGAKCRDPWSFHYMGGKGNIS